MQIFEDVAIGVGFAIAALLSFHLIPEFLYVVDNGDGMFEYAVMAGVTFYIMRAHQMSTLRFFRLPEFSFISVVGIIMAVGHCLMRVFTDHPVKLTLTAKILGVLYLFLIGLGEELVSRGFTYGHFEKYGTPIAVFASSLFFGLMHLNLYLGVYWNSQNAYYQVVHTFGFAIFAAAIMLATKSIWVVVLMHAIGDWSVVFSKNAPDGYIPTVEPWEPLWNTIEHTFNMLLFPIFFSSIIFVLLWLRGRHFHSKKLERLLLKLKLVEVEE